MALIDDIQNRVSTDLLRRLSTPDSPESTTLDTSSTSKLQLAIDDVAADFEIEAGVSYDNSDSRHLNVAIEGVLAKLSMRGAQSRSGSKQAHDAYLERVRALRGRVMPKTTSPLTVTEETSRDKPWADASAFREVQPQHDSDDG